MDPTVPTRRGRALLPRAVWLVCLTCLGCQSVLGTPPEPRDAAPSGEQIWSQGQVALRTGDPDHAIALYQQSLEQQPELRHNHFSLAAAHLAKGDEPQACEHLSQFIAVEPEHHKARYLYAELLFKRGQHQAAREHFDRAVAACQENQADRPQLIHCHSRLVAIAEAAGDEYETQLQRGIVLHLLAQARAQLGDPTGELPVEALLCKAAGCLASAHSLRPGEARPCWYLHDVWRQLAQQQQAQHWLRAAQAAAPHSHLSPAEQRSLLLACSLREMAGHP
jgi:tetratricopeptide (TPR) repeat protein